MSIDSSFLYSTMWSHICDQRITKQIKPVLPPTTLRARSQQISLLIACMQAAGETGLICFVIFFIEKGLNMVQMQQKRSYMHGLQHRRNEASRNTCRKDAWVCTVHDNLLIMCTQVRGETGLI